MLHINLDSFPFLQTDRLRLRQVNNDDAKEILELRSNEAVMKYLDRPLAKTIEDALDLVRKITYSLQNNEGITWAISLKDHAALIGTIGFWKIDKEHHRAEIGYMLHPQQQGKGLMQEAMTIVVDYGFKTMQLHSIEANVNPFNKASIKILERNNFKQEAYFRENYYYNGQFLDSSIYSLLAPGKNI